MTEMIKSELHKKIQEKYTEHIHTLNEVLTLVDQLPMYGKDCNCGDELEMGRIDYDIDFNDGSVTIVCMSCGGYVG